MDEIVDEEMAHLSKLDLDELRVIAIQRYRSAIEKASKSYVIESIRESIRAEVTSDLKEGPKKKDHKRAAFPIAVILSVDSYKGAERIILPPLYLLIRKKLIKAKRSFRHFEKCTSLRL